MFKPEGSNSDLYTSVSFDDDSSDEELQVESYDVKENIEKFKRDKIRIDQNTILSFITHAAGIYSLYSPAVQARYEKLKREDLLSTVQFKDDITLKSEIEYIFQKIKLYALRGEGRDKEEKVRILNIIKKEMVNNIVQDKVSYWKAYPKDQSSLDSFSCNFFKSLFEKKNCNLNEISFLKLKIFCPSPITNKPSDNPNFDLAEIPESEFVVEYLAHLRLHNRLEKRHLVYGDTLKDRETSWKIFKSKKAISLNNTCFKGTGRNEKVFFDKSDKHTYKYMLNSPTIQSSYLSILSNYRINIKKASESEVEQLSENTLSLWYLLFGCEVIRNPAALIHHNMAFDLIESKKLKWGEEMINKVPMLAKGAIQKAMQLNKDYSPFMPKEYLYQKNNDYGNEEELVTKEGNITRDWLELKSKNAVNLICQCTTNSDAVQEIWKLIMDSFDGWGMRSVAQHQRGTEALGCNQSRSRSRDRRMRSRGRDRRSCSRDRKDRSRSGDRRDRSRDSLNSSRDRSSKREKDDRRKEEDIKSAEAYGELKFDMLDKDLSSCHTDRNLR